MSRNRIKDSQSLHWLGVTKWVIIFGLLAGLALCYVLCKNNNLRLAEQVRKQSESLNSTIMRNKELSSDLEGLKSMKTLKKTLLSMNSTLVPWGDPRASWVRLDQNTSAQIARVNSSTLLSNMIDAPAMVDNAAGHPAR